METRLVCLLLAAAAAWADTYPRQAGVDAEHYAFRLWLSDSSDEIRGEARVDARVSGARELGLDLAWGMEVDGVSAGGTALAFTHRGDRLTILLPAGDGKKSVTVRYHGVPKTGLRIGANAYGERTFFSLNWPNLARGWVPMIDHPYDKATSEFVVIAPARYQVVANGLLQEETDLGDGRRLTHWKQGVPISSWLNAIAVAPFSVKYFGTSRGIVFSDWVYRQDREKGEATFEEATRHAFEFFSDFVGPYPYEKLTNVQAPGMSGGTEHASVIFYGEKSVTMKPATALVTHEIAHQWFGNSVTEADWDDVWLSEGFATYFTLLCAEHVEGREAFVAGLKRSRAAVVSLSVKLPGVAVIHENLNDMKTVLNRLIYEKGAWTLHMLRARMGREKFRAGIRDYYRRYQGKNATTADFQRVMEEYAGEPLGWYLDQWLRRPGVPEVEGSWRWEAGKIRVRLRQKQEGAVYRLPLELGIDGERVERVEMTAREQEFSLAAEKAPGAVELDPGTLVLMKSVFEKN